jgi:hypothetical protein
MDDPTAGDIIPAIAPLLSRGFFRRSFFSRSQDEARSRRIIEAIGGSSFDENQVLKFLSEIQGHVPWALVASKNLRIAMDLGLDINGCFQCHMVGGIKAMEQP